MTRAELIEYCLTYPGAVEDYPFESRSSTILRHAANRKWFALIFERDGKLCINLNVIRWRRIFSDRFGDRSAPAGT